MADKYLRTSDGSDADDGTTWALAKSTFSGVLAVAAASDNVYLDSSSTATVAASTTYTMAGTAAAPLKIISVSSSGNPQPPTATQNGAVIETTGTSSLTINGSAYFYGITVRAGVGSSSSSVTFRLNASDNSTQRYENCNLVAASTGSAMLEFNGSSSGVEGMTVLKNTNLSLGHANSRIKCYHKMRWEGGEIASGSAAINSLFTTGSMGIDALVSGVDLSRGAAAMNLIDSGFGQYGQIVFRNCKLPVNWTGKLMGGEPLHPGFRAILHNCSSGTTLFPMIEEDFAGKVVQDSVVVKQDGANDGAAFSWKITTKTVTAYPAVPFQSPEIPKWNTTTGSAIGVAVDVVWDSAAALSNADIWLEVQYPGSTEAKTEFISSSNSNILATATAVPDSSAAWTTTGFTTPKRQRLQVNITPQRAGYIQAKVCVGKPNATIYVDPVIVVV